jgi:LPXTG-motif cell wall-anchored protein
MLRSVAVAATLLTLVAIGPASASPRFTLTVNRTKLVSGHVLTVTASANVGCEWAVRWAGHTRLQRNTKVLVAHFTAPRVARARKYRLLAICNYRGKAGPWTRRPPPVRPTVHRAPVGVEATVPPHWVKAITITVGPPRPTVRPAHVTLPDTGGPQFSLLVLAFGLLLTGTGAIRLSRRRDHPSRDTRSATISAADC